MTPILRPLVVFAALQIGLQSWAWACSCVGTPNLDDAFDGADQVFHGEVRSVRAPVQLGCSGSSADRVTVRIDVLDAWKGTSVGETVEVQTPRSGASCGVEFEADTRWVVYASDGQTHLCSRTQRVVDGEEAELDQLDALVGAPD